MEDEIIPGVGRGKTLSNIFCFSSYQGLLLAVEHTVEDNEKGGQMAGSVRSGGNEVNSEK